VRVAALALPLALAVFAPATPAPAATPRSCPDVVVTPKSGDYWDNVKVVGVTCSFAKTFLRKSKLPKGWRYAVVEENVQNVCGGTRYRYSKGKNRITATRSAC